MINWGALQQGGGFQNALAMGMQMGQMARQARDEREYKNALAQFDPSNPETLKPIMAARPEVGIQLRGQIERQEASAQQQRMEQLGTFRRLLNAAGTNPQQAFAAAQQMGIDTSAIPQPGTPDFEPWRQQQLFIMDALEKEGDNLPGLAQEVMLALPEDQRDPNSPAFRQAFTAALENKYAAEYTDAQGNTRRRAIIGQQQDQAAPQAGAQTSANIPTLTPGQWQANVQSLGLPRAINWAASNGIAVPITGDEEFAALPSGAAFVGPDGLMRRKP